MDRDRKGVRTSKTQSKLKNPIEKNRIGKRSPSKKGGKRHLNRSISSGSGSFKGFHPKGRCEV
ncbi:MAG: hypothetical protein MPW14_22860 [Candidatus Manganitrophus sp.]|nr:MAG: hypothetical protein MPW14_22860 [Candidatus Manganitrophus sp.]